MPALNLAMKHLTMKLEALDKDGITHLAGDLGGFEIDGAEHLLSNAICNGMGRGNEGLRFLFTEMESAQREGIVLGVVFRLEEGANP